MATKSEKKLKGFSPARKFAWDGDTQVSGVWRDVYDGAAQLKIARFNNPQHLATLRKFREENLEVLKDPETKEAKELLEKLSTKALAECVLTDWRGILDEEGNEIPYSVDGATELLDNYEEFADLVFQLALETEQYRKYKEAEAVKN